MIAFPRSNRHNGFAFVYPALDFQMFVPRISTMRILLVLILVSSLAFDSDPASVPAGPSLNLMPMPAIMQMHPGILKLDSSFTVGITGYADPRLQRAVQRFQDRVEGRTGVELPLGVASDGRGATLSIECAAASSKYPKLGEDESYTLEIGAQQAILKANTVVGAMRGLETVLQLVSASQSGYYLPLLSIRDTPRFAWRGLMIDVSRHWQGPGVIKRNIDGLAAVKMNVFHWHLTDDQGFRVESKSFPRLQEMGSDGLYYTQEQIRDIVAYAADRGVRVVPEFDMPGHTTSWFVGYPDLASGPGPYHVERRFGVFDPAMDPTREETYRFLDGFLGEMAQLFPDEYIHIGGDENNGKQWKANSRIQQFMLKRELKDTAALQAYFNQRVLKILQKHGKKMIGWDEVLTPDLPKDVVVQSWRGTKSLADGAKRGYSGILSRPYYFDHMAPAEYFYVNDPLPADSDLTPEQAARVIGGESCAWGEFLSPENIDSRIWPRNAALAERLWSPRDVANVAEMYRRLDRVSVDLEQDGLTHESSTAKMLRQVTGTEKPGPGDLLAKVADPFGISYREQLLVETQLTPLTRVSDAVVPDAPFRRQFGAWVDDLLSDAPNFSVERELLAQNFSQWRDMGPAFQAMETNAPVLADCEGRVRELENLGAAGLEALTYLQSRTAPPTGWKEAKLALIDEAEKPDKSLLRLSWLPSYRALILAAADVEGLKTVAPRPWKQQVMQEVAQQEPLAKYTW
jgi:hexosaminidase